MTSLNDFHLKNDANMIILFLYRCPMANHEMTHDDQNKVKINETSVNALLILISKSVDRISIIMILLLYVWLL